MLAEYSPKNLTSEEWQVLLNACSKCKWSLLLTRLMEEENRPQDLAELDVLLTEKLPSIATKMYPSSDALSSLNGYLSRAKLPYRIKQLTYGTNCYRGTIQVKKHVPKAK